MKGSDMVFVKQWTWSFPQNQTLFVGGDVAKHDQQIFDSIIQDSTMKRVRAFLYFGLNCAAPKKKECRGSRGVGFDFPRTLYVSLQSI